MSEPMYAAASFALVAGVLAITPGVDTALVLRSAISQGRQTALATSVGIVAGLLLWALTVAFGVAALLAAHPSARVILQIVGGCYLMWLGARLLHTLLPARKDALDTRVDEATAGRTMVGSFLNGLATNLLNPKVSVFYLAMLPQFIPEESSALIMGTTLALIHTVETLLWFTLLILMVDVVRKYLERRRVRNAVDGATGTILIGMGLALALTV